MALGGGTWTSQDKVLPGSYINFVSADKAGITLSDRGVCAIPMELDWGKDGEVIKVNAEDVRNVSYRVFGHDYTDEETNLEGRSEVEVQTYTSVWDNEFYLTHPLRR